MDITEHYTGNFLTKKEKKNIACACFWMIKAVPFPFSFRQIKIKWEQKNHFVPRPCPRVYK